MNAPTLIQQTADQPYLELRITERFSPDTYNSMEPIHGACTGFGRSNTRTVSRVSGFSYGLSQHALFGISEGATERELRGLNSKWHDTTKAIIGAGDRIDLANTREGLLGPSLEADTGTDAAAWMYVETDDLEYISETGGGALWNGKLPLYFALQSLGDNPRGFKFENEDFPYELEHGFHDTKVVLFGSNIAGVLGLESVPDSVDSLYESLVDKHLDVFAADNGLSRENLPSAQSLVGKLRTMWDMQGQSAQAYMAYLDVPRSGSEPADREERSRVKAEKQTTYRDLDAQVQSIAEGFTPLERALIEDLQKTFVDLSLVQVAERATILWVPGADAANQNNAGLIEGDGSDLRPGVKLQESRL
jgi:hypothetical protein